MTSEKTAIARKTSVVIVVVVIVVAAVGGLLYWQVARECTFTASPGPVFLRVLSDSNQTSVAGAKVEYTNTPMSCNGYPAEPRATQTFVTNSTEWHPLSSGQDASLSFVVTYSGQAYNFSTGLGIEAVTCVTLLVPSGNTNVTFGNFQSTCPPKSAITSTTSSRSSSGSSRQYQLEFIQESNCPYGSWVVPWGVVLDNHATGVQPTNATLPLSYSNARLTSNSNYSTISFSVPNGVYNYTVVPTGFAGKQSGNVTVSGSNVEVEVWSFITAMGCSSSTTTAYSSSGVPSVSTVALANVTLSGFPGEIAVDSNNSRTYVTDLFANKLSVFDASNDRLVGTIALPGTSGFGIAIDSQRDLIFVPVQGCTNLQNASNSCLSAGASSLKGGIVEIAGSNDSIIKEFPFQAGQLVVNPSTGILYGAEGSFLPSSSNATGYLVAISERTGTVLANISIGAYPLSVAMDTKNDVIYIGACQAIPLPCVGAEVLMINGANYQLQDKVSLPFDAINFPVLVNSDTNTVYAMGSSGNLTLMAINGASGAIEYSSNLGGSCEGAGGGEQALNAQGNELYVAFASQNLFLMVNAENGQITNMLTTPQGFQGVAYNSGTNQVYVTGELANTTSDGYVLALSGLPSSMYVNYSLLSNHICVP